MTTPRDLARQFRETRNTVRKMAGVAVRKAAFDTRRDAQRASPVVTGALKNSIGIDFATAATRAEQTATVGPAVNYGRYVEEGTSRQRPQPYLMPAFDKHAPAFEQAMQQITGRLL